MSRNQISGLKDNQKLTVTQVKEDEFIVETKYDNLKIGGESDFSITYIRIDSGPFLHLGKDFLGMGIISRLDLIESDEQSDYAMIKITTDQL